MLLLLFLLLLLLSYLMDKEKDKREVLLEEKTFLENTLLVVEEKIIATEKTNFSLVEENKELHSKINKSQPSDQTLEEVRATLQDIVKKHDPLFFSGEPIPDDFEELVSVVSDIVASLPENMSELQEKASELDKSEQSISELEDKLEEAVGEIQTLEEQKEGTQNELSEAEEKLKRLDDELEESQSVVAELQDDNNNLSEQNTQLVEGAEQSGDQQKALENQVETLQESVADAEARAREALLTGMYESRKTLLERLKEELRELGHENINVDFRDGVLRLPEDVLFRSGDAEFNETENPKGIKAVRSLAGAMQKWIPCYTVNRNSDCEQFGIGPVTHSLSAIFIEGHTDNIPVIKSKTKEKYGDNWGLSSARAINTYKALIKFSEKLKNYENSENQPLLSVSAYSKYREAVRNDTPSNRKKNRRIDLRFLFSPTPNAELEKAGSRSNRVIQSIGTSLDR
jgi:myosin heavy subunit